MMMVYAFVALALQAGVVTGTVLDAATGDALAGAEVVLRPAGRLSVTDHAGRYRLDGVAAGSHQLYVRYIGYRPTNVSIDLPETGMFRLSIGLEVQPILLEAMPVVAAAGPGGAAPSMRAEGGRVDAERHRQERYLTGDVRALTDADALEAVTLGERDLLRAFQRLPGVTTRDDFTAHLWTRGARWSETRVSFDGLPLFNPVHAAGAFSAIHPDAVGAAVFHPGVRSAALGEGAAAALAMTSRAAAETTWSGAGELSVLSGRATVDRRFAGGAGFMLAARRSYLDLVTATLSVDSSAAVPYAFHDIVARLDVPLGHGGAAIEASALWGHDALRGDLPGFLMRNRGHWGNVLGRVSIAAPLGRWRMRHFVGGSRLDTHLRLVAGDSTPDVPSHEPVENTIGYLMAGGEIGYGTWRAGYEVVHQSLAYSGGPPTPYSRTAAVGSPDPARDTAGSQSGGFLGTGRLDLLALWAERRWTLFDRVSVDAGARVEIGRAVRNARAGRLAPRVMLRYASAAGRASFTAGWGRSFQYTQTIAPTGPRIGPDLHVTDVWLLAGDSVPALRADVVTAGVEYWIAEGWLGVVNAYARRTTGVTEPDPTPGSISDTRPPFVVAMNHARGLELSLRRLLGRVTVALAYSTARSETQAGAFEYAASSERRHVLDATTMVRVGPGLRLGAAVTTASGAPFTRFYSILYARVPCDTVGPACLVPGALPSFVEEPNAGRTPPHTTLDVLADWTWVRRGWEMGAYLQLRNLLTGRNASTYIGSIRNCTSPVGPGTVIPRPGICDRFDRGLPLLPLVGVRVAF